MEMGLFGKSKKEKASRRQKNTAVVPDLHATAILAAWLEKIQPTQRSHSAHTHRLLCHSKYTHSIGPQPSLTRQSPAIPSAAPVAHLPNLSPCARVA